MRKKRILIVEDDNAIRGGIEDAMQSEGFDTITAANGIDGLNNAVKCDCDLVLLDLVLPGRDGLEILKEVRVTRPTLPVIILTARGEEPDRVNGLHLGADDYIVKPFSLKELLARVHAVLRRSPERPGDVQMIPIPGGAVDMERREIRFGDDEREELSEREAEVLRYLICHAGRAIDRREILSNVWRINPNAVVETRTVDMCIVRLREKTHDDPAVPHLILTVRGKGYMWAAKEVRK
jgi:two-component system, OmpR family, alkaline phosphatase synthesis response regulator PhoP